jgi:hypothetical protein
MTAPLATAVFLLLVAPGLIWAWWCYPSPNGATRIAVGLGLGMAFQIHVSALLAAGPRITRESVGIVGLCATVAAGLLAWRTQRRSPRPGPRLTRQVAVQTAQLAALLALETAVLLVPLALHTVPQGWDPSFHSLLASTVVATGRLPTWAPFEPITSNYPYGAHVLIAEISLLTGIAPHAVFAALLNAVVPAITGIALYAFARRALHGHAAAMGAVAAYGLLGTAGIAYGRWGGLVDALGCFLLIAFLTVLFAPGREWVRVIVGGILLGAIPLVHHHVMLATVLLLVAYGATLVWRWLFGRDRSGARRSVSRALQRLILTGAVAIATVGYYVVPVAARAPELGGTSALTYGDHDPGLVLAANGWLLWALALAGAPLVDVSMRVIKGGVGARGQARWFVVVASVTLLLAFLLGYYGYRTYSLRRYHQPFTAFTPTHFLNDLTLFLALYAGAPLAALWRMSTTRYGIGKEMPTAANASRRPSSAMGRVALRGVIMVALVVTATVTLTPQLDPSQGQLAPGEAVALSWVRAHTPTNTLVMNLDPSAPWAPYWSQREVWWTPIPVVSEFAQGYVAEKLYLGHVLLDVMSRRQASDVVALASIGTAFPALAHKPVAFMGTPGVAGISTPADFCASAQCVYLLPAAFSHLQPTTNGTDIASAQWWPSLMQAPPSNWAAPDAYVDGWASMAPVSGPGGGTAYLRVTTPPSAGSGFAVTCAAQIAATLYVDGQLVPSGCSGAWLTLPALARPGSHVIAARAPLAQNAGTWFDLVVAHDVATASRARP